MAGRGPVVAVTITGDARPAQRAFDSVGDSAQDMSRDVDRASRDVAGGFDRVTDGADDSERKIVGLRDAFTGTGDVMRGFKEGNIVLLLTGFADLASSVANFAGPVIKNLLIKMGLVTVATETQTGAQTGLNVAMTANPIGIVIAALAALAAAFFVAYTKSETFRNAVHAVWDFIRSDLVPIFETVGRVALGIATGGLSELIFRFGDVKAKAGEVVTAVAELPGKIGELASKLFSAGVDLGTALIDGVKAGIAGLGRAVAEAGGFVWDLAGKVVGAIKDFINTQVIDRVNRALEITIPGPKFLPDIHLNPPDIPHLAHGGIVRARPGGTLLVAGEAGVDEAVVPLNRGGIGNTFIFYPQGYDPRGVTNASRRFNRRNGLT